MRLAYAHRGACVCRFYKHWVAQLLLRLLSKGVKVLHLFVVHSQPFCHLDAMRLQDGVGHLLIHAVGAGDGITSYKRDARQLEQTLDGAVLAVFTVQHREADVHRRQLPAVAAQQQKAFVGAVRRQDSGAQTFVLFPCSACNFIIFAGVLHPASVLCDADSQHLVLLRQVCQHRFHRHQRNLMLT